MQGACRSRRLDGRRRHMRQGGMEAFVPTAIPLALKLGYSAFMALLLPVYLKNWSARQSRVEERKKPEKSCQNWD